MTIKARLIISLAVLSIAIVTLLATGYLSLEAMNGQMRSIVEDRVIPLQQLKRVSDAYAVAIVDNTQKMRSGAVSWDDGAKVMSAALGVVKTNWTAYVGTDLTAEEVALVARATTAMTASETGLAHLQQIIAKRDATALADFTDHQLYPLIDPITGAVSALVDLQGSVAVATFAAAQAMHQTIIMLLIGLGLISVLAIGYSSYVVLRSVAMRLRHMEGALQRVATGDFASAIPYADRSDEIGRMARAAEIFRQNGLKVVALTAAEHAQTMAIATTRKAMMGELRQAFGTVVDASVAGDFTRRVTAKFADEELNGLANGVNELVSTVERGLGETGNVLAALAETDLTKRVTGQYKGAFAQLKADTNAVGDKLTDIVTRLRTASGAVRSATGEILLGANDLAERTTRQAAAIEQTSAAMEQLAQTVTENAKRADTASGKAKTVSKTAEDTGSLMHSANQAMDRISSSSQKISNVIGIIDDIAFQTNLLALNASVEAARAGDAGKGFAVVAIEVRRLAQSAAQASSEVKTLVEQSSGEVTGGSQLLANATEKLMSMLTGVRENGVLIEGIARASQEQSGAIIEVTTAVRHMDEMTQHNAALVEETNAAIEQTEAQATELDRIVDVFILDTTPTHTARLTVSSGIRGPQQSVRDAARSYLGRKGTEQRRAS